MSTFSKLTSLRELIMIEPYHRSFEEFNPDNHTLPPFLNFLCIDASSLNVISSVPSTSLRKLKIVAQPNDQDDMAFLWFNQRRFKWVETLILTNIHTCYDANTCRLFHLMTHSITRLKHFHLDLFWYEQVVGNRFTHQFNIIMKCLKSLPMVENNGQLQTFHLRICMEPVTYITDDDDGDNVVDINGLNNSWYELMSVIIRQDVKTTLKSIKDCRIALILKHGDRSTKGRSLVCFYKNDNWTTHKRWITNPMNDITFD